MNDEERGFHQSLWQDTVGETAAYPSLKQSCDADVVIIGGGITGLSTALHLCERGHSVVLLEAHDIGWGGSGRNGGQVNPGWKILPSEIEARYGREQGNRICALIDGACDRVFALIQQCEIDCAPRRAPYFRAAYGARGKREVEQWVQEWGEKGAPVNVKNQLQTHQLMGSTFFQGGMEDARGGSLQPLSYTRGLARAAAQAGAEIFIQSPVTKIERVKGDWQLKVLAGQGVSARTLIIATNGYTNTLWPGLKKQIVPVASLQAATRPLSKSVLDTLLPEGHHLSDTRRSMIYCRIDETGRFQIGGRGSAFTPTRQHDEMRHLQQEACRIFPQLEGVGWEYAWGGLVAITKSHAPQLIELDTNAYAGLGYNGRGVAMGTMMGKQLAELVDGEDVPMPREKLSPYVFHAFRNAGIAWHMLSGRLLDIMD